MSNGVAHGDLTLFDCPRVRRSEYWQFIKLVAPAHADAPPAGQTHWLSQDATDAFCLKCEKMFRFLKGSSNSVRRHMERFHRSDLLRHSARNDESMHRSSSGNTLKNKWSKKSAGGKRPLPEAVDLSPSSPSSEQLSSDAATTETPTTSALTAANSVNGHDSSSSCKKARANGFGAFEQRNATELLVQWLCRSLRALSVVADPGFAAFAAYISGGAHGFVPPDRAALQHHVALLAERARFDARQRARKELTHCSLALTLWQRAPSRSAPTPTQGRDCWVALSCHSLTDDFAPRAWPLDVVALPSDASALAAHLQSVLRDCALSTPAVVLLVSSGDERVGAAANTLAPRCVSDVDVALEQILSQRSGLLDATESAASSSTLPAVSAALAELQALAHVLSASTTQPPQQPQQQLAATALRSWTDVLDVATHAAHWQTVVATSDSTAALAASRPHAHTWIVAEALVLLLQPFCELQRVVAAERACSLPFLVPCLAVVQQQLERDDLLAAPLLQLRTVASRPTDSDSDTDRQHAEAALAQLQTLQQRVCTAFTRVFGTTCAELQWCAALDPRHSRLRHLRDDASARDACRLALVDHAVELATSQLLLLPPTTASTATAAASEPLDFDSDVADSSSSGNARTATSSATPTAAAVAAQGLMHRLLYDDDDDVAASPETLARDAEVAQTRLFVTNEVQMYLNEHELRKARVACPLQWWRTNRERFPYLAPLARMWLGATAAPMRPAAGTVGGSTVQRSVPIELCDDVYSNDSSRARGSENNISKVDDDQLRRSSSTIADMLFLHIDT